METIWYTRKGMALDQGKMFLHLNLATVFGFHDQVALSENVSYKMEMFIFTLQDCYED